MLILSDIGVKLRKTGDMQVVDETLRKFFLNFTIKDLGAGKKQRYEKTHELKNPWADFVKTDNFVCGRDLHTLLELFKYITENPEPSELLLKKLQDIKPAKQTIHEVIF